MQIQAVYHQHPPAQDRPDTGYELQDFIGHYASYDTGNRAYRSALGTCRHKSRCRRFRELASVARSVLVIENGNHSLILIQCSEYKRYSLKRAGIAYQVSGPVIIRTINHNILIFNKVGYIVGRYGHILGRHIKLAV